jgi:hypothetical protein
MDRIAETIKHELLSWEGVTAEPHRFGGIEFRLGPRELGHLHGSWQADLPFSVRLARELIAAGRASPHHILPETGWVTFYIHGEGDVPKLIELFRLNYTFVCGKKKVDQTATPGTQQSN